MPNKENYAITPALIAGPPALAPALPRKEMTIQDLGGVLSRRRGIVIGGLLLTMGAAAIMFATSTRLYLGSAEIQVQKEAADALSMNTMMGPQNAPDAVDSNITLQTQAQISAVGFAGAASGEGVEPGEEPGFSTSLQSYRMGQGVVRGSRHTGPAQRAAGRRAGAPHASSEDLSIASRGKGCRWNPPD
jgi:hypothetical protein